MTSPKPRTAPTTDATRTGIATRIANPASASTHAAIRDRPANDLTRMRCQRLLLARQRRLREHRPIGRDSSRPAASVPISSSSTTPPGRPDHVGTEPDIGDPLSRERRDNSR